MSLKRRLYNSKLWKKRSQLQKLKKPLCEMCLKGLGKSERPILTKAEHADHVFPWQYANNPIDSFYNGELQSLCADCHYEKQREDHAERRKKELTKMEFF